MDTVQSLCFFSYSAGQILQKDLEHTSKVLANTKEELKKCNYSIKERDFIISEQRKAGIL